MCRRFKNLLWKAVAFLPLRYRLPMRVRLMSLRLFPAEPEWMALSRWGPNTGVALDIGANRGFYSFALTKLYDRVVAFEPNPSITSELVACRHPRIELNQMALSDEAGEATLFVPRSPRGELLDGWASFNKENLQERIGEEEIRVPTNTLDSLDLDGVTFTKMDVEGHELSVLRGAKKFLQRNRPALLIEVRSTALAAVSTLLSEVGYRELPMDIGAEQGSPISLRWFVPKQ